jgi:hypothetical protein
LCGDVKPSGVRVRAHNGLPCSIKRYVRTAFNHLACAPAMRGGVPKTDCIVSLACPWINIRARNLSMMLFPFHA